MRVERRGWYDRHTADKGKDEGQLTPPGYQERPIKNSLTMLSCHRERVFLRIVAVNFYYEERLRKINKMNG